MTRIEIATAIKHMDKYKDSKVIRLASVDQISKGMDILPSEEFMFTPDSFTGWASYDLTAAEFKAIKAEMKKDLNWVMKNHKVEYVTDEGEKLFTSINGDLSYIAYDPETLHVGYRGHDKDSARRVCNAYGYTLLEPTEQHKVHHIAKKWMAIKELVG